MENGPKGRVVPLRPRGVVELSGDDMYAAIAHIHQSDGHGPGEKTWGCEMLGYGSTEEAARDAAVGWWEDTDQCDDCDVEISIERADGSIVSHRFKVGPEIVARRVS